MKTRNRMLLLVSALVIFYTVLDVILAFVSVNTGYPIQLDSTLTAEVFSFAKWALTTGASITVVKTIKGCEQPEREIENEEY